MTTLTMRPFAGETDLPAIVDLTNAVEAADQIGVGTSVDELRIELDNPILDTARDIALWEDSDGTLVALGVLWMREDSGQIDTRLWLRVRPAARGASLEREVIAWGAERLREVAAAREQTAQLRLAARDDDGYRLGMLEGNGFRADRYLFEMARPLDRPIAEVPPPQGFAMRHMAGEHEAAEWVDAYNQSFIDHWNHHDLTVEQRLHWMRMLDYRPELDLVALAPDGTLAAFSYCIVEAANNQRMGVREGWVADLGTRRGYRKRGLARALLAESLRRLAAAGLDTAKLSVDAQNPNGALRLYEAAGFQKVKTWISYVRAV